MRPLSVETFTHVGFQAPRITKAWSEDRLVVSPNGRDFAVIDGATSASGIMMNGLTDGAYIAQFVSDYLVSIYDDAKKNDILIEVRLR